MSVDKSDENCGIGCSGCGTPICLELSDYEQWIDDNCYCIDCMPDLVKIGLETMTLDELCEALDYPDQLYEWIYGEDVDNAVETIGNWWLVQRKKMFRKPTKSANKKI